jgi:nucleotidyltransferase/DNA polymerase involved in DNA repair
MRVAYVLIHNFAIQVAMVDDSQLDSQPLIIGGLPFEAKPVYDASPEAIARGVVPGMPLRQAYALCPEARFLPLDKKRYEDTFEQVVTILEGLSPVVEVEQLGCAYLHVTGIESEHDLACKIRDSIFSQTKLNACLGISSNKFLSRTGAFVARAEAPVIIPEGKEKEFIAPFSIEFLRCSVETKKRLHLLGIHIMSQLCQFSREALQAQFGSDGTIAYRLARGIDDTPLIPRKKPQLISGAAEFDPPLVTSHEMALASQGILDRLLSEVKAKGNVCHEVKLQLRFPSGFLRERKLPLKQATSSEAVIMARLTAWVEEVSFPEPVSEIEVFLRFGQEQGKKLYLLPQQRGREVSKVAQLLKMRFGYQPLKKALITDPDALLPERRFKFADFES